MRIIAIIFVVLGFVFTFIRKTTYFREVEALNRELPLEEQAHPFLFTDIWKGFFLLTRFERTSTGQRYSRQWSRFGVLSALCFAIALFFFWLSQRH